ncbi:MAG TPA: hypothetical protein VFF06_14610 [Polyangia bacterium]|nr:hypothetical protein [Polyangia bacterium]
MRNVLCAVLLAGLGGGCATADRARADYHEHRAEHAARRGNYRAAERQERKADQDEWKAEHAPLP